VVDLHSLFDQFKREKQFLEGVTAATLRSYSKSWLAFIAHRGCTCLQYLTEASLKALMVSMIASGLKQGAANSYARSINSFLSWLHENGHTSQHLRIPLTKQPKRVLKTYTPEEAQRIISHKPKSRTGKRVMALLYLLIDTGCRVNEALTLTRDAVDFNNLLVTLKGKGQKERVVPISLECRKALYRWLNSHSHALAFCTRDGFPLRYDNVKRDFLVILRACGVEKTEGSFHAFRRFFGKQYIRNGGNPLYLQRVFGHSTLAMVNRYVEADNEDLQTAHKALSPLESLKRR
jgi:site-specific recombinase XerD